MADSDLIRPTPGRRPRRDCGAPAPLVRRRSRRTAEPPARGTLHPPLGVTLPAWGVAAALVLSLLALILLALWALEPREASETSSIVPVPPVESPGPGSRQGKS
jgi:hypothetical protein